MARLNLEGECSTVLPDMLGKTGLRRGSYLPRSWRSLLACWTVLACTTPGPWLHRHEQSLYHDHGSGLIHTHWDHVYHTQKMWRAFDHEYEPQFLDALVLVPDPVNLLPVLASGFSPIESPASALLRHSVESKIHDPPCIGFGSPRSPPLS